MISFLIPGLLAGAALLVLPWLIHRIRRPEREPVRFSSLMFVPNIKKDVIERRKIQHWLLMLLRMLLLLLLILAFSRPFLSTEERLAALENAPTHHLIAVDLSFSMARNNGLDQAKNIARDVLDRIPREARVGLVGFHRSPQLLAALDQGTPEQTRRRATTAIDNLTLSEEETHFPSALQFAEAQLLAFLDEQSSEQQETPFVLHLISDFQRGGVPDTTANWRLSGRIAFNAYPISPGDDVNIGLLDVGLRSPAPAQLVVAGKVKNWSERPREVGVTLHFGDREPQRTSVTVGANNATSVSFTLTLQGETHAAGRLQLDEDGLALDNQRHFLWRQPPKKRILVVSDPEPGHTFAPAFFLEKALSSSVEGPWLTDRVASRELASYLANHPAPHLMLLTNLQTLGPELADRLRTYLADGGKLMLCLDDRVPAQAWNAHLFSDWAIRDEGLHFEGFDERRFEAVSWVDFEHPIFFAFRGARFNDFSSVRFNNYHHLYYRIPIDEEFDRYPRALMRLGGSGNTPAWPLMVEPGPGVMIWAASPELTWTNLPKNVKFVPLLHETLKYLTDYSEAGRELLVGDRLPLSSLPRDPVRVNLAGGEVLDLRQPADFVDRPLSHSGLVALQAANDDTPRPFEVVNVRAREADPTPITTREFALKYTANSPEILTADTVPAFAQNDVERRIELGYWLLLPLALFFLVELLYAVRLSKPRPLTAEPEGGTP